MSVVTGTIVVAALVGMVSLVVAGGAWRGLIRTGNKSMGYVVGAFALIAVKNLAKAAFAVGGLPDTQAREMVFSLMDLGAVALIAWPLVGVRS